MSRARTAGLVGGLLGVAAVGVGVGLAAERRVVGRHRQRPDPDAGEPFFALPADRTRTVRTEDGVVLHVEEVGPEQAPLTLVFVHGYTQEMAVWHYQRKELAADNPGRLVFYDQRAHGRSGRGAADRSTIDQLGRDLHVVLEQVVPEGPVVLVGHSMGGMTVMALADAHPELFGSRVVGVALVSTSTGRMAEVTFGLPSAIAPVSRRVVPYLTRGMRARPRAFERGRRLGTDLAFVMTRHGAFGSRDVSPSLVHVVERMTSATPVDVIAEFYDTFTTHDKLAALGVLRDVATLVVVGSKDVMTPVDHSEAMAQAVPTAELVVVDGAGHMVQLEQPAVVTRHLRALVERAAGPGRSVARSA